MTRPEREAIYSDKFQDGAVILTSKQFDQCKSQLTERDGQFYHESGVRILVDDLWVDRGLPWRDPNSIEWIPQSMLKGAGTTQGGDHE